MNENLEMVKDIELNSETIKRLQALSKRLTREDLVHLVEIQNKFQEVKKI